jgi:hypothetical protein
MNNGVKPSDSLSGPPSRAWARDLTGAIGLAESAVSRRIFVVRGERLRPSRRNAFGDEVVVEERDDAEALLSELLRARGDSDGGAGPSAERVAIIAQARALTRATHLLRELVARRASLVVHAIADTHAEPRARARGALPS